MPWYKARTDSASDYGDWNYFFISDNEEKYVNKSYFENRVGANTGHDCYRGLEYKKVKTENVPREIVDLRIKDYKKELENIPKTILSLKRNLKFFKSEAKKCKKIEIRKKCIYCNGKGFTTKFNEDCYVCHGEGTVKDYNTYNF